MLGKQLISGVAKTGYDVTKFTYIARVAAEPYSPSSWGRTPSFITSRISRRPNG